MKKLFMIMVAVMAVASLSFAANPVTVNAGGGGDFTTVQEAIDSWCALGSNAGETAPFVINVVGGPYDESFTLEDSVVGHGNIVGDIVIQSATPGTKVIFKCQIGQSSGTTVDDGFYVYQDTHDVTFTDIVFCPSLTNSPTDDLVKVDENTTNTDMATISFIDCVFTDIDSGTGDPLVTDKATFLAAPKPPTSEGGIAGAGDVLMKFFNDADESSSLVLTDCVAYGQIYHGFCVRPSGIAGETATITDCLTSNGADWLYGFNIGGGTGDTLVLTGTQSPEAGDLTQCSATIKAGWHGIWLSGTAPVSISNYLCDIETIGDANGRAVSAGSGIDMTLSDCILKSDYACILDAPENASTWDRLTLDSSAYRMYWSLGGAGSITATDCIFTNNSGAGFSDVPTGGITLNNCAVVTEGPDANTVADWSNVTQTNCISVDPMYISKDWSQTTYFDVNNDFYAGKASAGGNLAGGATYVGGSAVSDYVLY